MFFYCFSKIKNQKLDLINDLLINILYVIHVKFQAVKLYFTFCLNRNQSSITLYFFLM